MVAVTSRSFSKNEILKAELRLAYPDAKFNDKGETLEGESLVNFLRGFPRAITGLERITPEVLSSLPELKVISKYGVGLDMLDLPALENSGVGLGWTPGVNCHGVAELALTMMLSLLRRVPEANQRLRVGEWSPLVGRQLRGKTVGIVGCGHVGKSLVLLLRAFGCQILVNDIEPDRDFCLEHNIELVGLETLLQSCTVITLHVPLTKITRGFLSGDRLSLLPRDSVLINTARGGLIDEAHAKKMLREGALAGLGLDVFDEEPLRDPQLASLPQVLLTPHIGGSSIESQLAMGRAAIANLGQPRPAREFLKWI